MFSDDSIRIHPTDIIHVHSPTELDLAINLGFGITMRTRLLLNIDCASILADDPTEHAAGHAAHQFATDWVKEDGQFIVQIFHENHRTITGDIFNPAGDSLTSDLLNSGLADPTRTITQ